MKYLSLRFAAALGWHHVASVHAQTLAESTLSKPSVPPLRKKPLEKCSHAPAMPDAATRTYPTTLTTILSQSTLAVPNPSATTVDQVTLIDPWPLSPDPEFAPLTVTQTAVTQRTIFMTFLPPAPSPDPSATVVRSPATSVTSTTIQATSTYLVWPPQPFDMPDWVTPTCQYPHEIRACSLRDSSIKPDRRCTARNRETRCAAQCLLKDWTWWCATGAGTGPGHRIGRVCEAALGEDVIVLGEPCDHTDYKPNCEVCQWEGGDDGVWIGPG